MNNPKLCPFCHTWVSDNLFDGHLAGHTQVLPDGQMRDHVTVRPEERFAGDIAKEPKWYIHPRCGGVTGMPEEIIRSYLSDPFLYNDSSFCTGCNCYVPTAELFWQETNDSLLAASYRRKAEFIKKNALNPDDFVWDAQGPLRRKSRGGAGWAVGGVAVLAIGGIAALFLVGFLFLFGLVAFRASGRPRAVPAANAGFPAFNRDFPRVEIPKGPDFSELHKRQQEQMDGIRRRSQESHDRMIKQQQEISEKLRRGNDELIERLNSIPLGPPADFGTPGLFAPASAPALQDVQKHMEDARQRAQDRIDGVGAATTPFP